MERSPLVARVDLSQLPPGAAARVRVRERGAFVPGAALTVIGVGMLLWAGGLYATRKGGRSAARVDDDAAFDPRPLMLSTGVVLTALGVPLLAGSRVEAQVNPDPL